MFISQRAQDQTKKEQTLSQTFSQSDWFISQNNANLVNQIASLLVFVVFFKIFSLFCNTASKVQFSLFSHNTLQSTA